MLNETIEQIIKDMTLSANPSEEKLTEVFRGWKEYFGWTKIPEDEQEKEFMGIMRMRVKGGSISVVAPTSIDDPAMIKGLHVTLR